jgi:PAS domain S-box-containing protein
MTVAQDREAPGAGEADHRASSVRHSTQILCKIDATDTIVWCNETMAAALRYADGELIGANLGDLVHPEDGARFRETWDQVASETELSGMAARFLGGDGSWRWLEWTARADGARQYTYAAARDVTGCRESDEVLRRDESRLRSILDYSPSSIFVKDLQGRYLIVNRQWSRITGIAVEDVIGATASESWPAEAESIAEEERLLLQTGTPRTSDEKMHAKMGVRDFRVVRFLLVDDDGAPYAVGGIATDITVRTEAETALAGRERLLATVLLASPDIITLLGADGTVQQVSEADGGVLGRHYANVAGPDLLTLVHPDDVDDVVGTFAPLVAGEVAKVQVRFRVRHADGHWVTLDARGQAVRHDGGRPGGAVIVSRDMTARIGAEQRLRDAREEAERASRTKSEFLSRMSHELRTPLNSILGFAQLLQMDELPAEQSEAVDHILRAGRHLLDLIDEVLDIARIESGQLEVMMTAVPVPDIVNDAVELTRHMAGSADVSVRVAIDPDSEIRVSADRQRLLQVLLNLLSNAVKYNRAGGTVDVSCETRAADRVRLVVTDTGRGIPAEDVDRVFAPFDRMGAAQSGIEGTGVGLALSQHLVQRMGGRIGFESTPDVGSSFFVELALATGAPRERPDLTATFGWSRELPPADVGEPFRVLLMEDDVANLHLVEGILARRPGVELLTATRGGLGIELARRHRPDLILVDLHLPDMPGTAVLDRLVEDPATASLPVAVVGSDAAAHEVRQFLGRGVVGFLSKPFDVRALLSLVDAVRAARAA